MSVAAKGERPLSLGPIGSLAGYRLRRASAAFAADFARVMEGTGMRQVLIGILSIIFANPGINQGAVGHLLGIKRANMVVLINELLDQGLIERANAENDKRAFRLRLTQKGQSHFAQSLERIRLHELRLLQGLSTHEQATLLALLERIPSDPNIS